jgi:thiol-disulfide isomerase/thioredoxin
MQNHDTIRRSVHSLALPGIAAGVIAVVGCFSGGTMGRTGVGGLAVGDKAPPIEIQQLVHGSSLGTASDNSVQVIEFWATWCGPCLLGMPHLSELQVTYGDQVTILGVTSEKLSTVQGFLASSEGDGKTWGEVVKYRMAVDDNGATTAAYMQAAGVNSIPTAFIIGRDGVFEVDRTSGIHGCTSESHC